MLYFITLEYSYNVVEVQCNVGIKTQNIFQKLSSSQKYDAEYRSATEAQQFSPPYWDFNLFTNGN